MPRRGAGSHPAIASPQLRVESERTKRPKWEPRPGAAGQSPEEALLHRRACLELCLQIGRGEASPRGREMARVGAGSGCEAANWRQLISAGINPQSLVRAGTWPPRINALPHTPERAARSPYRAPHGPARRSPRDTRGLEWRTKLALGKAEVSKVKSCPGRVGSQFAVDAASYTGRGRERESKYPEPRRFAEHTTHTHNACHRLSHTQSVHACQPHTHTHTHAASQGLAHSACVSHTPGTHASHTQSVHFAHTQ